MIAFIQSRRLEQQPNPYVVTAITLARKNIFSQTFIK